MEPIAMLAKTLTAIDSFAPADLCRAFFILAASTVLLCNAIPPINRRFLKYGSRAQPLKGESDSKSSSEPSAGPIASILDLVSTLQVPHSWFLHFYVTSVLLSIFWAVQIAAHGRIFLFIASYQSQNSSISAQMTTNQAAVTWIFMFVQGMRRLYESYSLMKPTKSQMWFAHWGLGLAFYVVMSMAVWVEASRKYSHIMTSSDD
jgi:3-oxo-5-alpha-steroid 4-dehydrogenase 3